MARTIRFHLDEHVDSAVADGLRRRGIDVTTTTDAGLRGADDTDHIAFARADGQVIFSHDDDYLRLHDQGMEHAGIGYCHQQSRSIGEIIRASS
jgi:predicted nuclease of predicted toxin-antitoxin system